MASPLQKAPPLDLSNSPALVLGVQEWNRRPASEDDAPALNLSVADKADAERRFRIIEPLLFPDKFQDLLRECNGRKLAVGARLAVEHGCKARTIRNWVKKYTRYGMMGLVEKDRADKGTFPSLNRAAREEITALAIPKRGVFGALRVSEIYRAYNDEREWRNERIGQALSKEDAAKYARYLDAGGKLAEKARLPEVSCMTLRRFIERTIPEPVRTLARDGEEAYRNTQEIISHRDLKAIEILEYCVMDHRVLDAFVRVPVRGGWALARPWLTAALDMRSRLFLAWGLFEVPSSDSIATVLKKVFIEHGVPRNFYFDRGRDFRAAYLEGKHIRKQQAGPVGDLDPSWRGILGTLGVRVTHALAYNARAKIIEPCFNRISNFDRQLPEWIGHRPSARPERLDEMLRQHRAWERGERAQSPFRTLQEMADLYDAAIRDINERPLQGDGMQKPLPTGRGWMSPAECFDLLIGRVERRTVRTEDLHVVFTKRRELTVKHGEICATFGGQKFHYRIEGEPTQLMSLNGQLVEVAFDPNELSQVAIYWRDRFAGLAHCIALRKQGEDLFIEDEKTRRAARRDIKKAVTVFHQQQIPVASPEERLARRREVLPTRLAAFSTETPVQLPAPIAEAAAAQAAEAEFSFAATEPSIQAIERAPDADADVEFNFWSDQGD